MTSPKNSLILSFVAWFAAADLHAALDRAVCDTYGWEYAVLDDEEEILRLLLVLNLERAANAG